LCSAKKDAAAAEAMSEAAQRPSMRFLPVMNGNRPVTDEQPPKKKHCKRRLNPTFLPWS